MQQEKGGLGLYDLAKLVPTPKPDTLTLNGYVDWPNVRVMFTRNYGKLRCVHEVTCW